jgi:hypothetical protein
VARLMRLAAALAVVVALAAIVGAARADAGLFGCSYPTVSTPFAAWNDFTGYYMSPGGHFENGAPGWKLGGGTAVGGGNESFFVNAASDSHSLVIPAGGSAMSPYSCITGTDLKARFFAKSSTGAVVRVEVVVPSILGLVRVVTAFNVDTDTTWQPSGTIVNLANVLSLTSLSSANIALRFVAPSGTVLQIDDVYIDPLWYD